MKSVREIVEEWLSLDGDAKKAVDDWIGNGDC